MSALVDREVAANGMRHHVVEHPGDAARTVVLLHGYLDLARTYDRVIEALGAQGYRVIAPDFRGHGDTDRAPPGCAYHFVDYLADLDALLDALALPPAHLVGHSMGGGVASRYAGARPARVRSLALLEGVGLPAMPAEVAPDRTIAWLDGLARQRGRAPRVFPTLDAVVARMRPSHPAVDEGVLRRVAAQSVREVDGGLAFRFDPAQQVTSPMRYDAEAVEAFIPRIECPVLHVDGGDVSRWEELAARARRYPAATHATVPGAGHMLHWTRPDETAAALLAFLATVS